jgi:hypothetical protein
MAETAQLALGIVDHADELEVDASELALGDLQRLAVEGLRIDRLGTGWPRKGWDQDWCVERTE